MFLKIGHRGARAYEIENTIKGYAKAIELGVNAIELDLRESKDGHLIVIHDDNLKRVFGKDAKVNESTSKELKELTENRILTFEEALDFINKKVEKILVELKDIGNEKKVLEIIKKKKLSYRVIIISFHEQALFDIRKLDQTIQTGLIYARHKNPVDTALKLKARYLVSLYRFTHTINIEDAHKHNLKVIVWTINTKQEVKEYVTKGVDGIASDKPDIFGVIA